MLGGPLRAVGAGSHAAVPLAVMAIFLAGCTADRTAVSTTGDTTPTTTSTSTLDSATTTLAVGLEATGAPGDSAGEWVEVDLPEVLDQAHSVSLSEEALIAENGADDRADLKAYLLATREVLELPVDKPVVAQTDIDGPLVVWWEAVLDDPSGPFTDENVYVYSLPAGPKVALPSTAPASYPQVSRDRVTWVEGSPSEGNPEELWRVPIFGTRVDSTGEPSGPPEELVPSAIMFILGDSGWTYSLDGGYLAWEQAIADHGLDTGSHVLDLETGKVSSVGRDAWRPSVSDGRVAYWSDGVEVLDLATGKSSTIDPRGDFPAAAPTFVAYFRGVEQGFEIVVRGLASGKEQVLALQTAPPWLSTPIAVSATRVAFVGDDLGVRLFEWQGR